jgi:hypothetical protein
MSGLGQSCSCLYSAHQLAAGIKSTALRYSDFWALGCDRFAF